MKVMLTLIFGILISTAAISNTPPKELKVEAITAPVQLQYAHKKKQGKIKRTAVARVYLYKNSRIKKELNFRTKKNRAKMA